MRRFPSSLPRAVLTSAIVIALSRSGHSQEVVDPAYCYILDQQFAGLFDWVAMALAALGALVLPILAVYLGLSGWFWPLSHHVQRWLIVCGILFSAFLVFCVALPSLAIRGLVRPDVGSRLYFGVSQQYLQCTTVPFASRGFLFAWIDTGQSPSILGWPQMLMTGLIWFVLFAAVYWLWARVTRSRIWA